MIGTSYQKSATRVLLLGSGELGKEVAIECIRLGIEVIACDKYENAPAMHVAQRSHVFNMLDGDELRRVIELERPDYIVPEIEAIATNTLLELEQEGFHVVPCANATALTMNREGIRRLASETLGLATSPYSFADTLEAVIAASTQIGFPCVIKPVMSSSGKGQSVIHSIDAIPSAWEYAQDAGRAGKGRVIIEGFIDFDYEITQLTIHSVDGFHFCAPIGHRQEKGDYRESWQPHHMSDIAQVKAQNAAQKVVDALGGYGVFGVELFIKGDDVYFNEVSPRPHDTGLVTLLSQDLSEFVLHVRAFLGLPITHITHYQPSASVALLGDGASRDITFSGLQEALSIPSAQLRLFGKPEINGSRRLGVALASGASTEDALEKALKAAACVKISY